jgi:hypothetical protein
MLEKWKAENVNFLQEASLLLCTSVITSLRLKHVAWNYFNFVMIRIPFMSFFPFSGLSRQEEVYGR